MPCLGNLDVFLLTESQIQSGKPSFAPESPSIRMTIQVKKTHGMLTLSKFYHSYLFVIFTICMCLGLRHKSNVYAEHGEVPHRSRPLLWKTFKLSRNAKTKGTIASRLGREHFHYPSRTTQDIVGLSWYHDWPGCFTERIDGHAARADRLTHCHVCRLRDLDVFLFTESQIQPWKPSFAPESPSIRMTIQVKKTHGMLTFSMFSSLISICSSYLRFACVWGYDIKATFTPNTAKCPTGLGLCSGRLSS